MPLTAQWKHRRDASKMLSLILLPLVRPLPLPQRLGASARYSIFSVSATRRLDFHGRFPQ